MRVAIEFEWQDVGIVLRSCEGRLVIPRVPSKPGVYCFRVSGGSNAEVYIGESQDLQHRMLHNYTYMHKGKTNIRVREMLLKHLTEQREVSLAIATGLSLEVDGGPILADMTLKEVRLLAENAALTIARRAGERIHNL